MFLTAIRREVSVKIVETLVSSENKIVFGERRLLDSIGLTEGGKSKTLVSSVLFQLKLLSSSLPFGIYVKGFEDRMVSLLAKPARDQFCEFDSMSVLS